MYCTCWKTASEPEPKSWTAKAGIDPLGKRGIVGVGEYTSHFCVTKIYYLSRHSPVTFLTFCLREKKGFGCATIPAFLSEADEREQGTNFVLWPAAGCYKRNARKKGVPLLYWWFKISLLHKREGVTPHFEIIVWNGFPRLSTWSSCLYFTLWFQNEEGTPPPRPPGNGILSILPGTGNFQIRYRRQIQTTWTSKLFPTVLNYGGSHKKPGYSKKTCSKTERDRPS